MTDNFKKRHDVKIGLVILIGTALLFVAIIQVASNDRHARRGTPGDFGYERVGSYRPIDSGMYAHDSNSSYPRVVSWSSDMIWKADELVEGRTSEVIANLLSIEHQERTHVHRRVTVALVHFLQFVFNDISIPLSFLNENGDEVVHNFATPPLDVSTIYGTNKTKLKFVLSDTRYGELKMEEAGTEDVFPVSSLGILTTNNVLAKASPGLISIYTLFARIHNKIIQELKRDNNFSNKRDLFFTARAITNGYIQSIMYNEVLEILVGNERHQRLLSLSMGSYRRHANIFTFDEFANTVAPSLFLLEPYTTEARNVNTGAAITNTGTLANGTSCFLLGAVMQEARQTSLFSSIHEFPLRNVKYGRKHGLAAYQTVYSIATGNKFFSCTQITNDTDILATLRNVYGMYCDLPVDLSVGIAAEDKFTGALFGEVGAYLVELQFGFLRDGDPYFFTWDPILKPYLDRISRFRFVDAIKLATEIDVRVFGYLTSPFLL